MESVEEQDKNEQVELKDGGHDCPVCRAQEDQVKSAREQAEKALNTDQGEGALMANTTPKTTPRSSGRETVSYRHIDGTRHDAVVEGGAGTSLNLWVPSLPKAAQHKVGVAKQTARNQTNVWSKRW